MEIHPNNAGTTQLWSPGEVQSIKGLFTFTLMTLQERLKHHKNQEAIVLGIVKNLSWDVTDKFWRGTVMDSDGYKPSYSAYAAQHATIRILLNLNVHYRKYKFAKHTIRDLDLSTDEIIKLSHMICSPSRIAFSSNEQTFVRDRLLRLFPPSVISTLTQEEQHTVSFFMDESNFSDVSYLVEEK